jgi:hypothetical protein
MLLSQYAGGYTKEFADRVLILFETAIADEEAAWTLPAEAVRDLRKHLLDDVPVFVRKARRRQLEDDVPISIRRAIAHHQRQRPDGVGGEAHAPPPQLRQSGQRIERKNLTAVQQDALQDVPLSIRKARERPSPYGQRQRPAPDEEDEQIPQLTISPATTYKPTIETGVPVWTSPTMSRATEEREDEEVVPQWTGQQHSGVAAGGDVGPPDEDLKNLSPYRSTRHSPYSPGRRSQAVLQRSTETDELEDNEEVPQWKPDEQAHDEEAVDDEEEVPQWETPVSAQEAQEPTVPQWVPPPAERSIGVRRKITKKREPPQWYKENAEQVPYQEEEQPTEEHMPVEDEEMVPQYQEDYGQSAEAEPQDQDMEHEEYERPDLLGHGLSEADPMPDLDSKIKAGVRLAHRGLGHPANETFIRMLRLGGAPAEAISYARVWKCPTCERCKAPAHQRAAHTHTRQRGSTSRSVWM